MFQNGTVLRLKTTGESVVVLGSEPNNADVVVIRRPVNSPKTGVQHVVENYNIYELDTVEESIQREFNEVKIRQALLNGEKANEASLIQ